MSLKILCVAAEVAPYSHTGGLGEAAGSLSRAIAALGHEVMIVSPLYPQVATTTRVVDARCSVTVTFPSRLERAGLVLAPREDGPQPVFLDHPGFFRRRGLYGEDGGSYDDNARRFAFLAAGALEAAQRLGFAPDIVHAHDWHAGLVPLYARRQPAPAPRTVLTIHNLAHQGNFPASVVPELGLPRELFAVDGFEFYGQASFLKAGIVFADEITTVSPRYAGEVLTPEGGCGMHGILSTRRDALAGILNGIDHTAYDPARDPFLPARYCAANLGGKAKCREELLSAFGLAFPPVRAPVFGMVTRLADQKGLDLVLAALPSLVGTCGPMVMVGDGDPRVEEALRHAMRRFPARLGVKIGFDERLARLVYAGSDLYLQPSKYEPCGLAQMHALRYGSVPVVRAVGGLDDTVVDAGENPRGGTGFKFGPYCPDALLGATRRAAEAFADRKSFAAIVRRGMRKDFSWRHAATAYVAVYERALAKARRAYPSAPPPGREGRRPSENSGTRPKGV